MRDIVELEREVEHARENLMHTLDAMNRKATATAQELFLPEEPIRRYPLPSLCGAMALGMAAGGWKMPAVVFGILAVGGAWMLPPDSGSEHEHVNGS